MSETMSGDLGRLEPDDFVEEIPEEERLDQVLLKYLRGLDIPKLYGIIHAHLDQRGFVERMKGNIAFKSALIAGWIDATLKAHLFGGGSGHLVNGESYREMNKLLMTSEADFIRKLQGLGVHVKVTSELSAQKLASKPHLLMSTHQGGGLETYVLAELLRCGGVKNFRYVVKDELVNLPVVGKTIASRGPILVYRSELKDAGKRALEIRRIGVEIVEALVDGESVLFFFEGTRSRSGAVAHTDGRKAWCRDLNAAIEAEAAKYPGLDYGKALVVLDMLSVLPEAVEKDPAAQVRTNGDCTVKILDAAGLSVEENPKDPYDKGTLFGRARVSLKETLIGRVLRYRIDVR